MSCCVCNWPSRPRIVLTINIGSRIAVAHGALLRYVSVVRNLSGLINTYHYLGENFWPLPSVPTFCFSETLLFSVTRGNDVQSDSNTKHSNTKHRDGHRRYV